MLGPRRDGPGMQGSVFMLRGSCCCKAIEFEVDAEPKMIGTCHCSRCRKTGAPAFIVIRSDAFRFTKGQEFVARYVPEPPYTSPRLFCQKCGTALAELELPQQGWGSVAVSALDGDPGVRNRFHEYVNSKAPWYEILDGQPQFQERPVRPASSEQPQAQ
jgi:hypothetical protein